ncbi:hypothetical protein [Streptomyces sp. DB-54]
MSRVQIPPTADGDEALSLITVAAAWTPRGSEVPDGETVREAIDRLTVHGRDRSACLRALLGRCGVPEPELARVRATLGEAERRLPLPPPLALPQAVVRAQSLGRLIEALDRALSLLRDEEADGVGQWASTRGYLAEDVT